MGGRSTPARRRCQERGPPNGYIRNVSYRLGLSGWTALHNHYPAVVFSESPVSADSGINCCSGYVSGSGNQRCNQTSSGTADFYVWLNSATPTTPQAACQ